MKADEEYKALQAESRKREYMTTQQLSRNRSVCLAALPHPHQGESQPEGVVGTLDLYAVRALEGEVLIGKFCSAYVSCYHSRSFCSIVISAMLDHNHHMLFQGACCTCVSDAVCNSNY